MKYTRGFTLVELLLYITIVAMLLGGLMSFFVLASSVRVKSQSISEVDQQGLLVMDTVSQAIRNADSVTTPVIGGTASSLTLASTTAALNPTIVNLSGSSLQIKEGGSAAVLLTNNRVTVSSFSVKNLGRSGTPGSIQVSFTLSTVNASGRSEYDYRKTFTTTASVR